MINLIVASQISAVRTKVYPFENGTSINQMIRARFGELYDWDSKVFLNGNEVLPQEQKLLSKPLSESDEVKIIVEAKGIVDAVIDNIVEDAKRVVDLFTDLLVPDLPEQDTQRSSPNNSYQSQTNTIRAFQQKAIVCGSPRIYPDLIQQAIEYFEDNQRVSEQYLYCSLGNFTGGTIQLGNTSSSDFSEGVTIERYQPVNSVTTIPMYRAGESFDEVDGQVIRGTNEGELGTTYNLTQATTQTTYFGSRFTAYADQSTDSDLLKTDFDDGRASVIEASYLTMRQTQEGIAEPTTVQGNGTITSMELNGTIYTIVIDNFNGPRAFEPLPGPEMDDYRIQSISRIISASIGPFAAPIRCEKMLFNISFLQGLNATVDLRIEIFELDGKSGARTGNNETFNFSYTAEQPNDEQNRTFEAEPARGLQWYEFTITRTNEESQDTQRPDVPTLDSVFCIRDFPNRTFQNATMLRSIIRSTPTSAGSGASNRINIINGQQNMPSYNRTTGQITANAPSRKCADAVLFMLKDFHGYSDQEILRLFDIDALYTIQDRLDALNPEFAQFDFTFDDTRQGLLEQISIITNVMRVQYFSDGNKYSFWRDEAVTEFESVLSRTDIVAEEDRDYSITRRTFVEGDKDSIQIEYIDRTINKPTFIYRSVDSTGTIVNVAGRNPKRVTLTGCQSLTNANNRANLEIRKLLYQHTQGSDTFLNSAVLLSKGDVVTWDEIHETTGFVTGQFRQVNGNVATLNREIDTTKNYNLYFSNVIGAAVGPQAVTINNSRQITAPDLGEAYQPSSTSPLGSRFYLVETSVTPQRWRIIDKEVRPREVQLTMTNYDPRIYGADP